MITCNIYIYIYITPGQALRFLGPLNVHGAQSILGSFGQSDIAIIILLYPHVTLDYLP